MTSGSNAILHVRKFVIVLVSVDCCLGLVYLCGLFQVSAPSVSLSIYHVYSLPVYDMIIGGCVVCEDGLVGGGLRTDLLLVDCDRFFSLLVYCSFGAFCTYFLNNLPVSPM